ncbi:MAG: phosphoribosylanthranilate isomerase [Sphingobacteriales bacterium]|nr:phosphoribosylanthranilate isomerase [Sphingobacteriales bacterium]
MNIKVCGITQLKQLQQLDKLNIDYAGFIFFKGSPRYVVDKISKDELSNADFDIKKVGVFVNADYDEIMKQVDDYSLDIVQLHGDESPELCEEISENIEVIKAFRMSNDYKQDIDELVSEYDEVCDYYLFDTAAPSNSPKGGEVPTLYGGTGEKFDWKQLSKARIEKPFFLSGGIGMEDAAKVKGFKHPDFFGVDINSRFEKEPGVKDLALVMQFKMALRPPTPKGE